MATIIYDNRYEQTEFLAGGGVGIHEQGAMAEVVLVKDRSNPEKEPYVLKRPMVSPGNLISPRQLQLQNDAIVKELQALKVAWDIRDRLACQTPEIIKSGVDDRNFLPHKYNYFVITRASGKPLSGLESPPPFIAILNIYTRIIESLRVLHDNHIVFNDTRHEHFFWDEVADPIGKDKNSLTLIDFGNAYFLPGSSLERFNFKEALGRKTAKDDYIQLAQSLYRLITGGELQPTDTNPQLPLKKEFENIGETINLAQFSAQINLVLSKLLSGESEVVHSILQKWIGVFGQHREIEFSKITESIDSYDSFSELENIIAKRYTLIGKPDKLLLEKWKKHFDDVAYNRIHGKIKSEVNELIEAREWTKLLGGPLSQLFRLDPDLRSLLESIIEDFKDRKVSNGQIRIISKLISHDFDGAIDDLPALLNRESLPEESELSDNLLPFAANIYRFRNDFQPSAFHPQFFIACRNLNTPGQLIDAYNRLLAGEYGVVDIKNRVFVAKIIPLTEQIFGHWSDMEFEKVSLMLDEVRRLDRLNPAIEAWDRSCNAYKGWVHQNLYIPSNIPAPDKFNHRLLENIRTLTPSFENPQITHDILQTAEGKLYGKLLPSAQMGFQNWTTNKKADLRLLFENAAKDAFDKPSKNDLIKFTSSTEQSKYLEENLPEWYQLCWCIFQLAEKQQKQDLKIIENSIDKYIIQGKEKARWNLLKKGINYFQMRVKDKNEDSDGVEAALKEFRNCASDVSQSGDYHWLYRLFVLEEQAVTTESFFRTPSYAKKQKSESVIVSTKTKDSGLLQSFFDWREIPTVVSVFMGGVLGIIVVAMSLVILQSTNLINLSLKGKETEAVPDTSSMPQSSVVMSTSCDQTVDYINTSEYSIAQTLISECKTKEEQERIIRIFIAKLTIDVQNKKYDSHVGDLIMQVSNWEAIDDVSQQALLDLNLCNRYLGINSSGESGEMYNALNEMVDWIDQGAPGEESGYDQWQTACGWRPSDLLLRVTKSLLPYSGVLIADQITGAYRLNVDFNSNPQIQYLPKTMRHYEVITPVVAGEQTLLRLQDDAIPGVDLPVDLSGLYVLNDQKERRIKLYWNYEYSVIEIGYIVYAPLDAISAELVPGTTIDEFAFANGITKELVGQLNPGKALDSIAPVQLIIVPSANVSNVVQFEGDTRDWYEISVNSLFSTYVRNETSLSMHSPEIVVVGVLPEGFPGNFQLDKVLVKP